MSRHDHDNTMAKTISQESKTSWPTKSKAGGVSKQRVKIAHLAATITEPTTEHIATRVRFAEDIKTTKMYRTTAAILNPTTIKTSTTIPTSILKVRPESHLVTMPRDVCTDIVYRFVWFDGFVKEEPADQATDAPTNAPIKEEPIDQAMDVPTNVLEIIIKEEPADLAMEEVTVDHSGKPPSTSTADQHTTHTTHNITNPKARTKAHKRKEVAVDHDGKLPSPPPTKKARGTRTRPRTPSSTPTRTSKLDLFQASRLPDIGQASSYLPSPEPTSSTKPNLHRTPSKHVLNPEHLHFRTTSNPALNSHHLLRFPLTDDHYESLEGPLASILKERGLRTKAQRVKITAFKPEYKDDQSKYLVEGHPVQSGATASNKTPEPKLLRPEWLLGGPTECGKCGSSFGRIENGTKKCNQQMDYHQGTLVRRSRAKNTYGMILPSTISTCKAEGPLVYA